MRRRTSPEVARIVRRYLEVERIVEEANAEITTALAGPDADPRVEWHVFGAAEHATIGHPVIGRGHDAYVDDVTAGGNPFRAQW